MEKINKVISIDLVRDIASKTPTNETIHSLNRVIKLSAEEFKNEVELDLSYIVGVSDNIYKNEKNRHSQDSYILTGKEAYLCLPKYYRDVIDLFHKDGYKFEFRADAHYNTQPFEEGHESSFKMKIKW